MSVSATQSAVSKQPVSNRFYSLQGPFIYSGLLAVLLVVGTILPRSVGVLPAAFGLFCFGYFFWQDKAQLLRSKTPLIVASVILAFILISVLWSIDQEGALKRVMKLSLVIAPGAALIMVLQNIKSRYLTPFINIFPVIIAGILLINAFELVSDGMIYKWIRDVKPNDTYTASQINRSIVLAVLPVFIGLAALKMSHFAPVMKGALIGVSAVSLVVVMMMTHSQSAHIAAILGLVSLVALPLRLRFVRYSVVGAVAALMFATPFIVQYLFDVLPPMTKDYSWFQRSYAAERLEIWDFVARYALQNPLYGYGIEATRFVEAFDTQRIYHPDLGILHPHNFVLQIWIEFGALGIVGAIVLFYMAVEAIAKLPAALVQPAFATLIANMAVASTGYGLWQGWWIGTFVLMTAYIVILARMAGGNLPQTASTQDSAAA